ncbi:MAG TPA: NAD(P)/FAD-dependent oxidoreductase [Nevskiaceae bacterium]|nr:NAD(P)/FAD-dependent oxidoreductase [Nevskiaceae bacterium]
MSRRYDAIVVGARCAGAPTAMLLARKGYRVLLVDRVSFPSDTMSTHLLHPVAVASLARWGLLERLAATGCPPIHTYAFDFGPVVIAGTPGTPASPVSYCPRRTVLDKLLVDAAAEAGAHVREDFRVDEVVVEHGRVTGIRGHAKDAPVVTEHGRVVVGADGRHSLVAEAVQAPKYHERAPLLCPYYAYFSDLPLDGRYENYVLHQRGFAAAPTHDGLTMVVGGWPIAQLATFRDDVEGEWMRFPGTAPAFAERFQRAKRVTAIHGAPTPGFFRKPFGPGWALVGDAGYLKDPITAQGILDAFRDAEATADALDDAFAERRTFEAAMADVQQRRDAACLPMFEFTCQLASLEPPPPELQQLLGAIRGNREAMDGFARMNAGTISPAEWLAPANVEAMLRSS